MKTVLLAIYAPTQFLVPANPSQDYLQPQSDEDLILTSYSSKSYFVRILILMLLGIQSMPMLNSLREF